MIQRYSTPYEIMKSGILKSLKMHSQNHKTGDETKQFKGNVFVLFPVKSKSNNFHKILKR